MAGLIADRIQKLKKFRVELDQVILDLVRNQEQKVIEMNTDQLMSGIDGNGKQIAPPYAISTIVRKKRKGQPYGRVTLRDQGDFHSSFGVEYMGDEFQIINDDPKAVYLIRRYGEDVYGLTQDNVDLLAHQIKGFLAEELKRRLT